MVQFLYKVKGTKVAQASRLAEATEAAAVAAAVGVTVFTPRAFWPGSGRGTGMHMGMGVVAGYPNDGCWEYVYEPGAEAAEATGG